MARNFNSNNHIFRPTSLGAAMVAAGVIRQPHLVRDNKLEVHNAPSYKPRMLPVRRAVG